MTALPQGFDATQIAPDQGQGKGGLPVSPPEGHVVMIVGGEYNLNKSKVQQLQIDYQIIEGPSTGEEGSEYFQINHSNPQVVEIAFKQLSALCHITGNPGAKNIEDLFFVPLRVKVQQQTGNPKYTEVAARLHIDGKPAGQGQVAPKRVQTQAPPAGFPPASGQGAAPPPQQAAAAPPAQPQAQMAPPQAPPQQPPGQPAQVAAPPAAGFPPQPQQQPAQVVQPQQQVVSPPQNVPQQQPAPQQLPPAAPGQATPGNPPWGQPPTA